MKPFEPHDVALELQDLTRNMQAYAWLYESCLKSKGDLPNFSWTASALMAERDETIRCLRKRGGLLLIGGVYRELDGQAGSAA